MINAITTNVARLPEETEDLKDVHITGTFRDSCAHKQNFARGPLGFLGRFDVFVRRCRRRRRGSGHEILCPIGRR